MGRPKHLIPIDGVPMLVRVVRALRESRAREVAVVLRSEDAVGRAALKPLGVRLLEAEDPDEGRAASVRAGVRAAAPEAEGLLFALADQPFLEPHDFDALIAAFARAKGGIVHASYAGQRGSPVLFAARYRDELLALRGSDGGRALLRRHSEEACAVELDVGRGRDVDRPGDL